MRKDKIKVTVGAVITEPGSSVRNKTGDWRSSRPVVDALKCTRCGTCWVFCPDGAITISKEKGAVINYDYCKGCGICSNVCPFKAIVMKTEEK